MTRTADARWARHASLALGPVPAIGFALQFMALGATVGAIVAARSFRRTRDADR
jgi:hypothetical protein